MTKVAKRDLRLKVGNIKVIDVQLEDIEVGERFRVDMGDIEALAASISSDGLIQPIAIIENYKSSEDLGEFMEGKRKRYKLIAGGRRYRALEFIKSRDNIETITCRLYDKELTELESVTLEFAENLYRKDLTWQEECNLKERIYTLQQKIHGVKYSTAKDAPGFSLTDMSKMTGRSKGSLSEDISLAKMMKDIPEVNWEQFKTKDDAKKALKTAKKKVVQTADAKKARASLGTGDSLKKNVIDSYHVQDFFEGVKNIGDSTMDIVELDPPYGIALQEKKKRDSDFATQKLHGYNEIDPKEYPLFMTKIFSECYRVLKPNSWFLCWFGHNPWFEDVHQWLLKAGFKNSRMCAIWVKGEENDEHVIERTSGQSLQPERGLASAFETFYYARKGVPMLARPGMTNVFGHKPIPAQLKVHPTERPLELMADILTTFAQPNSRVLVPCCGSGNTMIAAVQNQMIPVGYELTEEYYEAYIIKIHKLL